jgi:hypothetical protein
MNKWIEFQDNWFNLDWFWHIWIDTDIEGRFYLMAEFAKSSEEVVISPSFDDKKTLMYWFRTNCKELI